MEVMILMNIRVVVSVLMLLVLFSSVPSVVAYNKFCMPLLGGQVCFSPDMITGTKINASDILNLPSGFVDTNETTRMNEIYTYHTTNRSLWDTAYGWGNHSGAGYITTDTNETSRINNMLAKNCTGEVAIGFHVNGTIICETDDVGVGGSRWAIDNTWIINSSDKLSINLTSFDARDSDTTYTAGYGIELTGTIFTHNDTSSQASSDNSGRTYIQDIILDTFGHITSIVTATETVIDTNETVRVSALWGENTTIHNRIDNLLNESDTNETTRMNEIYTYHTTNRSLWDTAYGWGNHSGAGYLTDFSTANDLNAAGDVNNDSHTHSLTNITGRSSAQCSGSQQAHNVTLNNGVISLVCSAQGNATGGGLDSFYWGNVTHTVAITDDETIGIRALTGLTADLDGNIINLTNTVIDTNETVRVSALWGENTTIHNRIDNLLNESDTNETTRMNEIYTYHTTNRSLWDTAYGWGNHSEIGYLTTYAKWAIDNTWIINNSGSLSINETTLNNTIDARDSDTTYTAGYGIELTGTIFTHNDTSSQASSDNSGRTYIQDIILDTFGHITSIVTATETVTDTTLTQEQVEDYVGGMVTNNTETNIAVTYQDADGTLDFVVSSTPTFTTVDTGHGANELYAMNQDVRTTDNVTFAQINVTEHNVTEIDCIVFRNGGQICAG